MEERQELERKLRALNKVKREIDDAKSVRDQKKGKLDGIMERLSTDYGVDGVDGAQKEIHNINQKLQRRNAKITEDFGRLNEEYDLGK